MYQLSRIVFFPQLPLLLRCESCSELFELLFSAGLCSAPRFGSVSNGWCDSSFFVYEHTEECTDKHRLMLLFLYPGEFTGEEETLDFLSTHSYEIGLQIVFQGCWGFNQLQIHMDKKPKEQTAYNMKSINLCIQWLYVGSRNACFIQTRVEVWPLFINIFPKLQQYRAHCIFSWIAVCNGSGGQKCLGLLPSDVQQGIWP